MIRKLNSMTEQDSYPLPRIEDILDHLGNCKYFTTMDLESGYYQVLITKEDRSFSEHLMATLNTSECLSD